MKKNQDERTALARSMIFDVLSNVCGGENSQMTIDTSKHNENNINNAGNTVQSTEQYDESFNVYNAPSRNVNSPTINTTIIAPVGPSVTNSTTIVYSR
jgi:hypothetical protein